MTILFYVYIISAVFMLCFNHYEIKCGDCTFYTNGDYVVGTVLAVVPIVNSVFMLSMIGMFIEKLFTWGKLTNKISRWWDTPIKKGNVS